MTAPFDPESFVQRQLDACNARDVPHFVAISKVWFVSAG